MFSTSALPRHAPLQRKRYRRGPDHVELDFPQVTRFARIRRDRYDLGGALISKEVVHAVTSLDANQASAADLAAIARGQWGIESVHCSRL